MTRQLKGDERAEARALAAELYGQGLGIRGVAERIGRSYTNTQGLLREAGVQMRPVGVKTLHGDERDELRRQAVVLYGRGLGIWAVAERIGRSYTNTRDLLVEAGVQMRPRGYHRERP